MALETPICDFGRKSIDFKLKATDGNYYTYNSIKGQKATLVMFICNHCPYVRSIILRLVDHINILKKEGVGIAAIMSNFRKKIILPFLISLIQHKRLQSHIELFAHLTSSDLMIKTNYNTEED